MITQMIDLELINLLPNQLAFSGIELLNIILIIFSPILICLSYVLYRLYRANKQNKSISRMLDKSGNKGRSSQTNDLKD